MVGTLAERRYEHERQMLLRELMSDERFEQDHAPGGRALTASRWPGLVLDPQVRPSWMPGPLALALHMRGDVPLESEGKHLELGHMMEGPAEKLLARYHGILLDQLQPRFERSDIPAVCYPDALVRGGERLVEIKTVIGGQRAYEERWGAGVPLHVRVQAQAQSLISGIPVVLVVPIIIGYADIRCEVIEEPADPAIQDVLMDAGQDFIAILATGGLPEADASESSYRALLRTTTLAKGKSVLLDGPELVDLANAWRRAKDASKGAEETCERAKHQFAALLGDAEQGVLDDGSIVRRSLVKESSYTVNRKESWRWSI